MVQLVEMQAMAEAATQDRRHLTATEERAFASMMHLMYQGAAGSVGPAAAAAPGSDAPKAPLCPPTAAVQAKGPLIFAGPPAGCPLQLRPAGPPPTKPRMEVPMAHAAAAPIQQAWLFHILVFEDWLLDFCHGFPIFVFHDWLLDCCHHFSTLGFHSWLLDCCRVFSTGFFHDWLLDCCRVFSTVVVHDLVLDFCRVFFNSLRFMIGNWIFAMLCQLFCS